MAVCHHHAPAVMPFCITGKPIVPVFHVGGAIGAVTPFWDQHDEFGDTDLLVVKPEEGRSLARALGPHSVVLMKRHGATVVGAGLRELVSRSIFLCQNADYQLRAIAAWHAATAASRRNRAGRQNQREAHRRGKDLGILEPAAQSERLLAAAPQLEARARAAKPKARPAKTKGRR